MITFYVLFEHPSEDGYDDLDLDGNCEDIDECNARTHSCTPTQDCNNQEPFFKCSCHVGYIDDQNGDCVDLDECTDGYHDCHSNADCLNSDGSYTCRCHPGYSWGLHIDRLMIQYHHCIITVSSLILRVLTWSARVGFWNLICRVETLIKATWWITVWSQIRKKVEYVYKPTNVLTILIIVISMPIALIKMVLLAVNVKKDTMVMDSNAMISMNALTICIHVMPMQLVLILLHLINANVTRLVSRYGMVNALSSTHYSATLTFIKIRFHISSTQSLLIN